MSHIGVFGAVGLIVIVLVLFLWIGMLLRARRNPSLKSRVEGRPPPRGPVSGGVMRGDPGQVIPTGEVTPEESETERRGSGPLDL
jgi:hypothetical protein